MTPNLVVAAACFAVATGMIVSAVAARSRRNASESRPDGTYFAPQQSSRYLKSSLLPVVLGVFAATASPTALQPDSVAFWALGVALLLCLLAWCAIFRTGSDFVDLGEDALVVRQLGYEWRVPWSDFEGVSARGPFLLEVHVRDEQRYARRGRVRQVMQKYGGAAVVYITTLQLGDQLVIQGAIETTAQSRDVGLQG